MELVGTQQNSVELSGFCWSLVELCKALRNSEEIAGIQQSTVEIVGARYLKIAKIPHFGRKSRKSLIVGDNAPF